MPVPASATTVGAGGRSPSDKGASSGARGGGGTVRQRKAGGGTAVAARSRNTGGAGSMWRFYTGESILLIAAPY